MDASPSRSPYKDVVLPESVEMAIQRIRNEKVQPELKMYARKMLEEIGEQDALELLRIVSSAAKLVSFSGYVSSLVKQHHPLVAASVLRPYESHNSPSSSSPRTQNGESLWSPMRNGSVNSTPSHWHNYQKVGRTLSFDDEPQEQRRSKVKLESQHIAEPRKMTKHTTNSQQLITLSKLEYKKLFLVLSYIGRQSLEAVVTIEDSIKILEMKDLPMEDFESQIWIAYGQKFYSKADRSQYIDWDSRKTHLYYCYIFPDRSYYFKGPYLYSRRTHLQRSLGDDNVLIVKFSGDGAYDINEIVEEGIFVGLRQYRFFVFKSEHKRVKKNQEEEKKASYPALACYFVHLDSVSPGVLYKKSISEARLLFMHVHTVSTLEKYMARFSLILSNTRNLPLDFAAVNIETIEDIPFTDDKGFTVHDEDGKAKLHTDGTGFISEDLAMQYPNNLPRAKHIIDNNFEKHDEPVDLEDITCQRGVETRNKDPPLLMQCRLFHNGLAVKGTLLVNKKLKPGTIQIRPSMIKVERDHTLSREETFNALEICNISHRPGRNYLSRNLIALLSYGGVPQEFFLNLLTDELEQTRNVYSDRRAALRVASNNDSLHYGFVAQRMISCGVPLDEPYLQQCLSRLEHNEKTQLKKGKIPISESFYLMGTADPTGLLENDQVYVILDNGPISGKVLVYRNPGLHFGDVHVMEAVYKKELIEVVGNAKYGIFFSTKGCKSAAYEIATGDFDGDKYWVSRNPELLKYYKAREPWSRTYPTPGPKSRSPQEFSGLDLERQLLQLFLNSRTPSFSMVEASESWLSFMDRLLTLGNGRSSERQALEGKMKILVDIYYDALDAPKSGKKVTVPNELRTTDYPHYLERASDCSYNSTSILGNIYNRVLAIKNEAVPKKEIEKLPLFDAPKLELYDLWSQRYGDYRKEMRSACSLDAESKNDACSDVIKKYKQLLYEAPDFEESAKNSETIYEEAIAIYHVAYDYAMSTDVERCGFAWKVACTALCDFCAWKLAGPREKPIAILPSVLRSLLYK